jgi:hypothetical protein
MVNVSIDITEQPIEVDIDIVPSLHEVVIEIDENGGGGGGVDPATQTEVNAGIITNKYVSPATFDGAQKWNSKFNQPSGTTSEYIRGDGSLATFPSIPTSGIPGGTATGTNTYALTIAGVTAYNVNDAYVVRFTNANTGACSLNINGLGAINISKNNVVPIVGGDIAAGQQFIAIYDGTNFQLIGVAPNQMFAFVTNADSVTITKGQVVYAFGAQGDRMSVKLANNSGDATSAKTIGVVFSTSIAANGTGYIITQGVIDGLNLGAFNPGDTLYLSNTNGQYTATKPYAPNHLVYVGIVERANAGNGQIYVRVQNGYEMDELHDVSAQNPNLNDGLFYNSVTALWTARAGTKSDVGLANVDNTSDANKPISTATQTALNAKENTITAGGSLQYFRGDKTFQNYLIVAADGALYTNTGNTTSNRVLSILIPANTYTANSIVYFQMLTTKTLTNGAYTVRTFIHTSAGVGGTQMSLTTTTGATQLLTRIERIFQVQVANGTGNGTRGLTGTTNAQTEVANAAWTVQTSVIDWTQTQYLNIFLQNASALDTTAINAVILYRF